MRKFYLHLSVLLSLIAYTDASAQLYVGSNAYVYVNDAFVYVKQDVNLNATGNIYLRKESQLLQGTTGVSTNSGAGKLSAFQEGSVNSYNYNYWCSPVGDGTVANNFGIGLLNSPTGLITSSAASITSLAGYNGVASNGGTAAVKIEPYWIWKYIASSIYAPNGGGWIYVGNTATVAPGLGFSMKGTLPVIDATTVAGVQNNYDGQHQRYDFRGLPNDGNITVTVAAGKQTLTGNPYPSAMDLTAFLTDNLNCTGIAYFWESDKTNVSHRLVDYTGGYGTFSPVSRGGSGVYIPATFKKYDGSGNIISGAAGGASYARRYSPIGQGFMIEGVAAGIVTLKNIYRLGFGFVKENAGTSVFEKNGNVANAEESDFMPAIPSVSGFDYTTVSKKPVPQIRLNSLIDNAILSEQVLAFDAEATDGLDHAMDAKSSNEEAPQEVFFPIDNSNYVIDVINFDANKKIPLGLRNTKETNFKISVSEMLSFTGAKNVYIHDKQDDTYHDIKKGIFEVNMPAGYNITRFEITFMKNSSENNNNNNAQELIVLQNNDTQMFTVNNPQSLNLKEVSLYELSGKLIYTKAISGSENMYQFPTKGLSEGIYIVNLITKDNQKIASKLSIFKSK